jgi:hypothetical protein
VIDESTHMHSHVKVNINELHAMKTTASGVKSDRTPSIELNDELLDRVFGYVGGGEHLFVAGVNRNWRGRYMQYYAHTSAKRYDKKLVTRHRTALISLKRLQFAQDCGLGIPDIDLTKKAYATAVSQHSLEPLAVITELKLHGVSWDERLCSHAAYSGRLLLLKWLRKYACPWNEGRVLLNASSSGNVHLLEWLKTVKPYWTSDVQTKMLFQAGYHGKPEAAQWLKSHGAAWPDSFANVAQLDASWSSTHKACWPLPLVQWAIRSGSGWLTWRCEDYNRHLYRSWAEGQTATAMLKWAHANGCPFTCGHQQQ